MSHPQNPPHADDFGSDQEPVATRPSADEPDTSADRTQVVRAVRQDDESTLAEPGTNFGGDSSSGGFGNAASYGSTASFDRMAAVDSTGRSGDGNARADSPSTDESTRVHTPASGTPLPAGDEELGSQVGGDRRDARPSYAPDRGAGERMYDRGYGAPAYSATGPQGTTSYDRPSGYSGSGEQYDPGATAAFPVTNPASSSSAAGAAQAGAAPGYAPAGYPQPYQSQSQQEPQRAPATQIIAVPTAGSRATAAALGVILGLILTAAGVFLLAKYGLKAETAAAANGDKSILELVLAALGAALITAAVGLNGWSAWSTVLPGIALTGLGGWAFLSRSGLSTITRWTNFLFPNGEIGAWHAAGFTLVLGLVLLAASLAAAIARRAGRRRGELVERADAQQRNR